MKSIMEIASIPEEEWTKEEREKLESFNSKLDDLLKITTDAVNKAKRKE